MNAATRDLVRRRAGDRCEYCQLSQDDSELTHHVEHIVARQHGGTDDVENLALACHRCNLNKGRNLTGIDPKQSQIAPLFHPRRDQWGEHFRLRGALIQGLTASGRATIHVLALNDARRMELRLEIARKPSD